MRAAGSREMRPLREPEIRKVARLLSTEGHLVDVGDAVDPNGFPSQKAAKQHRKEPGRGAR